MIGRLTLRSLPLVVKSSAQKFLEAPTCLASVSVRGVKSLYEEDFFGTTFKETASKPQLMDGQVFTNKRLEFGARRFYRGRIKAAIFDWGGTVVDCGVCAPILTYVELFREEGVEITEDEARAPMGSSSRVHIGKVLEKEAVIKRWKNVKNGKEPTEADVDRMVEKFIPQVLSSLQKYTNVIDGVSETVSALRKNPFKLKIGSTTGYPQHVLNVLLNASASQGELSQTYIYRGYSH